MQCYGSKLRLDFHQDSGEANQYRDSLQAASQDELGGRQSGDDASKLTEPARDVSAQINPETQVWHAHHFRPPLFYHVFSLWLGAEENCVPSASPPVSLINPRTTMLEIDISALHVMGGEPYGFTKTRVRITSIVITCKPHARMNLAVVNLETMPPN